MKKTVKSSLLLIALLLFPGCENSPKMSETADVSSTTEQISEPSGNSITDTDGSEAAAPITATGLSVSVNGTETVNAWNDEESGKTYLFLPSYADPETTVFSLPEGTEITIGEERITDGMSCSELQTGKEYPLKVGGTRSGSIIIMRSENVATLYINTESGSMNSVNADKQSKENAMLTMYTPNGTKDYSGDFSDKIRGHGHSTWLLNKKPYNLHMDKKTSFLGMSEAKKWVLIANAYDETCLRNKLVYDFAHDMAGYDGFSPECAFVDVYENGEYSGLYLLCRSMKDISSEFLDDDMYEFELTMANKVQPDDESIELNNAVSAVIKSPSPCDEKQKDDIAKLTANINKWITSDKWESDKFNPDIDSWAKKVLVELVFDNYDGANASQYFWGNLNSGSVYAGPCWDYDLSMGVYYIDWSTPYAFIALKDWNNGKDISWYSGVWAKPEFREYAIKLYRDKFRDRISDMIDHRIANEADTINAAMQSERIRWSEYYKKSDSFDQSIDQLTDFMNKRVNFIDSFWLEGEKYFKVTMILPNGRTLNNYVKENTAYKELPMPSDLILDGEDIKLDGKWYCEDGSIFDKESAITKDIVLYAG